ncbi:MAG: methylenetetrahydrofolate reductase [NAD(P)H] [Candidatus Latescibacterota bacterium]|nr:MAG: methylenetetrahydrofolate reductase [NAD(P)H] [Candidatus Latescibacterota bacterium]
MRVIEHLDRAANPLFSYEIIPPARGKSVQDIIRVVEQVMPFGPPFIDVTSHPAEASYEEQRDGTVRRRIRKKRPGTISICGIISIRYKIDTVPHLLCRGFSREETEDAMIELNYLGIHNVLAIRGDEPNYNKTVDPSKTVNVHAYDLVKQLADLKRGAYLEDIANSEPIDMCIGVGGYPEKHVESPNLKTDIRHLKEKVDAGAEYVVTQMFFDNRHYFDFVKACRDAGITVPIIPGIRILDRLNQLTSLPKNFHNSIPEELSDAVQADPDHVKEIGKRWGIAQIRELLGAGVKCVHFYIMSDAGPVLDVIRGV